jgi:hypothetical protein
MSEHDSEHSFKHAGLPPGSPGFEEQDADSKSVIIGGVGILVVLLIAMAIMKIQFSWEISDQGENTKTPFSDQRVIPAGPLLQASEYDDQQVYKAWVKEDIESYGWVSKEDGVVKLPIDRAMEVVLANGLPVRGPNDAPPTPKPKPAAAAAPAQKK